MENITDDKYIGLNYNVVKENETTFVDFTGEATCDDEPCTILIRFEIDKNVEEFEIVEVKVDKDVLNEDEILDLLEDIAYVGGAVVESDHCCDCDDCSHCAHECNCDEEDDEIEDETEDKNGEENEDEE